MKPKRPFTIINLSLRGLDRSTLSRLRSHARRCGISVNRLIVETLQQRYSAGTRSFDDLDALAGRWTKAEADAFAAAIAPLAEIDQGLWAGEPKHAATAPGAPTRPRLPLFESREPRLAERAEEALDGFGKA